MTSGISRLGQAAVAAASLTLLAACAAGSGQSTVTTTSSSTTSDRPATGVAWPEDIPSPGGGVMAPQVHVSSSSSSSVVGGGSSGKVVVTVNGRTCQLDVADAVSVRTVTENSQSYVEITDRNGRTRRVDCSS